MQLFVDICDLGSFSKAAARHIVSQSAVSQRVAQLERRLGHSLFDRKARPLTLTSAGHIVYDSARQLLAIHAQMQAHLEDLQPMLAGPVRLGCIFSLALGPLRHMLRQFLRDAASVELHVTHGETYELAQDVLNGLIDLALVAYGEKSEGIQIEDVGKEPMILVAPPGKDIPASPVPGSWMNQRQLVTFPLHSPTRRAITEAFTRIGVGPDIVLEVANPVVLVEAVAAGRGCCADALLIGHQRAGTGRDLLRALPRPRVRAAHLPDAAPSPAADPRGPCPGGLPGPADVEPAGRLEGIAGKGVLGTEVTMATTLIKNGRVLAGGKIHDKWVVRISGGKIGYVGPAKKGQKADETIDAKGLAVVPGFVDLHIHGGAGSDFMDATLQDYCTIAAYHAAGGTTAWMPTTATDRHENVMSALKMIRQAREQKLDGPAILGAHVEGPYLTLSKCGCHDPDLVRPPRDDEAKDYLDNADIIGRITIAPDLPGALGFIRAMSSKGVLVSGGHSEATYALMMEAIDAGMRMVTHLYSAMSSILKAGPFRSGGMLEATMLDDRLSTELIADGKHVPPELLKLALKTKDPNTVSFTTDAMRGAGAADGVYTFGGKAGTKAIVEDGVARNLLNTGFASSTVRMVDLARNGVRIVGLSFEESIRRCSEVPARIAGVFDRKGSLAIGKDADIVLLDEQNWQVKRTIIGGKS